MSTPCNSTPFRLATILVAGFLSALVIATPASAADPQLPLKTQGAKIIDSSGNEVVLQGVNWFGFETSNHAPHGLWTRDYKEMLAQIKGQGFNLALDQTLVIVSNGCRLVQKDASLQAGSCRWNWQNQQVQANGGVVLQRPAQQQVTRAGSLSGRLGTDGLLVLRAPGSKVRSTLKLPLSSPSGRNPAATIRP